MKKNISLLFFLIMAAAAWALNPTTADKQRCYMENTQDSTITFLYTVGTGYFTSAPTASLYVRGSMNGWGSDERYRMAEDPESGCWFVTLKWDVMNIPGNGGHPEFKFYKDGAWVNTPSWLPSSYRFGGNNAIVIFSSENIAEIDSCSQFAQVVRPLADFDLTDPVDQHKISNFRQVPATTQLFRSYHPFHAYRAQYDTEHMRLAWIDSLATRAGIMNDICLSENETGTMRTYTCGGVQYTEQIPAYYQQIIQRGGVLYVGTQNGSTPSYNDVYFNSTGAKFGQWVAEVVDFIIDPQNPGPFQIHCALGTDRTGVFSATLAALCGATWEEVAADYESTNNMQIEEYRSKNILAYSFRRMCGVYDITTVPDLSAAISNYFIQAGYLTQAHIDCLRLKLNGTQPSVIPDKYVIPQDTATNQYKTIVVKCYSPAGAPTIWWWNGGDRITQTSKTVDPNTGSNFTWNGRPAMPSVQSAWDEAGLEPEGDVEGWYYWCFTDVDAGLGIDYIFTVAGGSKSEDLNAKHNECRNQQYAIVDDCPALPMRMKAEWNVSDSALFGGAGTAYLADTTLAGLTLHADASDARQFKVEATADTLGSLVFAQRGLINGAAKETYRYLSFDAEEGDILEVYARGGSNTDRELYLGFNDFSSANIIAGPDSIYAAQVTPLEYELPQTGIYTLYTKKGSWYFYAARLLTRQPAEATQPAVAAAVEDASAASTAARKVFRNGQVLIIRGGRTYDLLGREL